MLVNKFPQIGLCIMQNFNLDRIKNKTGECRGFVSIFANWFVVETENESLSQIT